MVIKMNKKKIITIISIIAVLVISAVAGFYLLRKPKIVPELIGTWEIDPEATNNYTQKKSIYQEKIIPRSIDRHIKDKCTRVYKEDNTLVYGNIYSKRRFNYRIIKYKDNIIRVHYKLIPNRTILESIKYKWKDDFYEDIIIIDPYHFAWSDDDGEIWIVYKKSNNL